MATVANSLTNGAPMLLDDGLQSNDIVNNGNEADSPVIDIVINNVVCSFSVRCHLNLRQIALEGYNVEYRKENGMVTMKLRSPSTTASIWSSGKITCTGTTSEEAAKVAARRVARCLQKLGFKTRFGSYRVVNVLGTCAMPFGIHLQEFTLKNTPAASYEPELHPGVTYKMEDIKGSLKIFSTGSITVTAPCVQNVQYAIERIFPLVYDCRKVRDSSEVPVKKKTVKRQYRHLEVEEEDDLLLEESWE